MAGSGGCRVRYTPVVIVVAVACGVHRLQEAKAVNAVEASRARREVGKALRAAMEAELLKVRHVVLVYLHGVIVWRRQLHRLSGEYLIKVPRVRVRLYLRLKWRRHLQRKHNNGQTRNYGQPRNCGQTRNCGQPRNYGVRQQQNSSVYHYVSMELR